MKEWNSDPRRAAANPLHSVNDVKRRLAEAAPIGPEQRWAALAGQLDQRLLRQGDWPALAQLMQNVDDQGHDVAALTRAVTTTPLNDLPAQDLRYRLAAHLDLGDDQQRPPVHTSTAKTTTRRETAPGSCRVLRGNDADAPSLTKRFLSALATAVVTTKMINTPSRKVPPETPPLTVVLAASLARQPGRRRHLSTLGDRPRGKPAQPESGRRSWVAATSGAAPPC